jgi:hypothetical protein
MIGGDGESLTEELVIEIGNETTAASLSLNSHEKRQRESATPTEVSRLKPPSKQPTLTSVVKKMDSFKATADRLVGDLFFGCNFSFKSIDSPFFKNFVRHLNPSYKPPCAATLSSTILDSRYTALIENNKKPTLQYATLFIDGWKNSVTNKKFVTAMVKPRFLKAYVLKQENFSETTENSSNLKLFMATCFDAAKSMYNLDVEAISSDNAANMVKARGEINLPDYGCAAHAGDLQLKTISDEDLIKEVVEINKELRSSVSLQNAIISKGGKKIYRASTVR